MLSEALQTCYIVFKLWPTSSYLKLWHDVFQFIQIVFIGHCFWTCK